MKDFLGVVFVLALVGIPIIATFLEYRALISPDLVFFLKVVVVIMVIILIAEIYADHRNKVR